MPVNDPIAPACVPAGNVTKLAPVSLPTIPFDAAVPHNHYSHPGKKHDASVGSKAFHAGNNIYFQRADHGDVAISKRAGGPDAGAEFITLISGALWAGAVAAVSGHDDLAFHKNHTAAAVVSEPEPVAHSHGHQHSGKKH